MPVQPLPLPPSRAATLVAAAAVAAGAADALAQSTGGGAPADSTPVAAAVVLAEWGLDRGTQIRFGELSFAPGAPRPALRATTLRTELPPDPATAEARSRAPDADDGRYTLGGFDGTGVNRLGGYFTTFQRAPSWSRAEPVRAPDGRPALGLTWRRESTGFAGLAIQLFDGRAPPGARLYLDSSGFDAVVFWVRGQSGGEDLLFKVADARWQQLGDALPVGPLGSYLPGGRVEARWQRARIPLDDLPRRLDRRTLASLVLEGRPRSTRQVFLTAPVFLGKGADPPPLPSPDAGDREEGWPDGVPRATWIWNTEELLLDLEGLSAAVSELQPWDFDEAYLQIPVDSEGRPAPARLAPLVRALSDLGTASWALDGSPRHALPELHARVLATVEAVAAHNTGAPPEERFVGVRHDIEPYLLPGFGGPRRDALLGGYLEVVAESARRVRDAGLRYGLDIPFWYDAPDPWDPEGIAVEHQGETKPVSHHLLGLADEVAIMSYRTEALGAGGALVRVLDELTYAGRTGSRVLIALESEPLPDEVLVRFQGEPRPGTTETPGPGRWIGAWTVGDSLYFGLADGDGTGATLTPPDSPRGNGAAQVLWWPVAAQVRVEGADLSFAGAGREAMERVARRLARLLAGRRGFGGVAFHHAGSLVELSDGTEGR